MGSIIYARPLNVTAVLVVDLAVTGLICVVGTQAFRLIQRLLHGDNGSGGGVAWQHRPNRPGGGSRRGPARRPPLGGAREDRRARNRL
jgi:hypothetical protein